MRERGRSLGAIGCAAILCFTFGRMVRSEGSGGPISLSICRTPGVMNNGSKSSVYLPRGSGFADAGPAEAAESSHAFPVNLATAEAAILLPNATCIAVEASIISNRENHPVAAGDGRLYRPTFEPEPYVDLTATVMAP